MRTAAVARSTAVVLVTAGCATRGVVSGPADSPGTGTWAAVGVGAVAAVAVLAGLVLLPGRRRGGSVFAASVLAAQAGAALVGGAVLVGAAVRSEQLVPVTAGAVRATSLLRLTGIDGDHRFFWLTGGLLAAVGILVAIVSALAARSAADTDPIDRAVVTGVLGVEAVLCLVAVGAMIRGDRHLWTVLPAALTPVFVAAAVLVRPEWSDLAEAQTSTVGYNDPHG